MSSIRLPDLIAHRGNVAEFPRNSLPALHSALELGARYVEFDVQLTGDRQPILLDDPNLKRTAGIERNALEMTWRELEEIPVSDERQAPQRHTDIGIPKLSHAVSLLSAYPWATAFVELKRSSLRAFGHEIVVRKVCEVLKPVARQCVIVSFDLAAVHHVRQLSSYRIGWRVSEYTTLSSLKCEALTPDYVFCDRELLTDAGSRLWRGPWRWAVHDVTSRNAAVELAARGVRLVGTSEIRSMLREFRGFKLRASGA